MHDTFDVLDVRLGDDVSSPSCHQTGAMRSNGWVTLVLRAPLIGQGCAGARTAVTTAGAASTKPSVAVLEVTGFTCGAVAGLD